jgi:hypothetical protein
MGVSGCFAVCCSNLWKISQIGTWHGIWKKIWAPNGFVGSPCWDLRPTTACSPASVLAVDATLWEERDKARQQKIDKLNNDVLPKVAVDK